MYNFIMKEKIIILFLCCTICFVASEPNSCCENNERMLLNSRCPSTNISWAKNCQHGAYILPEEEFRINEDGSLQSENDIVPKERACVGKFQEGNETIALVCFKGENTFSKYGRVFCSWISVTCLAVTLIVYLILPNVRDLQGKCMMFAIFSLMMAFLFLSTVQTTSYYEKAACVTIASLVQFWFCCTFFWLNVVSFNVWRSVVCPKLLANKKFLFILYNSYGWGIPLLIEIITLIAHHVEGEHISPEFGVVRCWFNGRGALWLYFYGPVTLALLINILLFVSTVVSLWKQGKIYSDPKLKSKKFKCMLYLRLFIIMGICWIFEPMSEVFGDEDTVFWLITDYINGLQGLLIFLLLIVFRKRVRQGLAKRGLCCHKLSKQWVTMANEDCEELEEDVEELSSTPENASNPS